MTQALHFRSGRQHGHHSSSTRIREKLPQATSLPRQRFLLRCKHSLQEISCLPHEADEEKFATFSFSYHDVSFQLLHKGLIDEMYHKDRNEKEAFSFKSGRFFNRSDSASSDRGRPGEITMRDYAQEKRLQKKGFKRRSGVDRSE